MGNISKHFSFCEFEQSVTAKEHGIDNTIKTSKVRDSIAALTNNVLEPLREELGARVDVNSGFRCDELNKLVGGADNSQHTKGEAADIKSPFYSPLDIARRIVLLQLPFDQLILYPTFVHVSHKLNGKQRGQVLYNKSYKGEKIPTDA